MNKQLYFKELKKIKKGSMVLIPHRIENSIVHIKVKVLEANKGSFKVFHSNFHGVVSYSKYTGLPQFNGYEGYDWQSVMPLSFIGKKNPVFNDEVTVLKNKTIKSYTGKYDL